MTNTYVTNTRQGRAEADGECPSAPPPPSGKEGEKEKMINYTFFNIFQKCLYTRLIDNRQFESKVISPAVLIECF